MSKQQYAWMLGLMAAWRQQAADDDKDGARLLPHTIYARAGIFVNPPTRSANDQALARMLLLIVLALIYANSRAKLCERRPFSREIRGGAILWAVTPEPAWLRSWLILAAVLARCQNEHLPTFGGGGGGRFKTKRLAASWNPRLYKASMFCGGVDGTRTRDPRRDRPVF
jgi:hypothetical protein